MTKTRTPAWFVRLTLVAAIALIGTVASGAFAAHPKPVKRTGFSVFSHRSDRAHKADATGLSAPQGSLLANVISAGGATHELYAWHRTPQEICLVDVEPGIGVTTACSPDASAEEKGVSFIGGRTDAGSLYVAALVPNGVNAVEITESDGSTRNVLVVNNVAGYAATGITAFRYVMPNGTPVSHAPQSGPKAG